MRFQLREFFRPRLELEFEFELVTDIVFPAVPRKARGDAAAGLRIRRAEPGGH
jgi:hypothetical protein